LHDPSGFFGYLPVKIPRARQDAHVALASGRTLPIFRPQATRGRSFFRPNTNKRLNKY
jgi:hypothetical protein